MNSTTTPTTSSKCSSLTAKPMVLKFGENLLHLLNNNCWSLTQIQRWIWKEQLFEIKLQGLCHGNLSMFNACTHLSHEQHLSHIRTNHTFLFFFSFPKIQTHPTQVTPFSLEKSPWPSLSLFPLPNGSFEILSSNQWPPHPLKTNENWDWFALQLMRILGPNDTQKNFHPPIK